MKQRRQQFWQAASSVSLYVLAVSYPAAAQIVPDTTLPVNSIVTPHDNTSAIEGGTRAGGNLFHSFQEFSVPTGGTAFFNNALDVQNILSRVTGSSISNIDGLIRANGAANLFLLNPNGIIFGSNARLNIGGSFLATTANSFQFADGNSFSATAPQATPILTISVPVGLQYNGNGGQIRVEGLGQDLGGATSSFDETLNPLEVNPGNTLTLLGGNVTLNGGILQAPGGRVEIGGLAGTGTVELRADGSLTFPLEVERSDIVISDRSGINVLGGGGGSITINARNLDISENSLLTAGIVSGMGSVGAKAGNIALNATGGIAITASRIENNVNPNIIAEDISSDNTLTVIPTIGDSADINIQAGTILLDTAQISTATFAEGNSGDLILAANSISITNGSLLQSSTFGTGNAGNIRIDAQGEVAIIDSRIQSNIEENDISGTGNAGNILVQSPGTVNILNGEITSQILSANAMGNGGNIVISGGSIAISQVNVSRLETSTIGVGNAGDIELIARDNISIERTSILSNTSGEGDAGEIRLQANGSVNITAFSSIESQVLTGGNGNSGTIAIEAFSVALTDGSELQTNTLDGSGNAGNVTIKASDMVAIEQSAIASNVEGFATGNAGNISISARAISFNDNALIQSSNFVSGNAGNIFLEASKDIAIANSNISSDTFNNQTNTSGGFAGIISINAGNSLQLFNSMITAESFGGEEANPSNNSGFGLIFINAPTVSLSNQAIVNATTSGSGAGGDINIQAASVSITEISTVQASSFGRGEAGNVTIDASDRILISNSSIASNATVANAGTLTLKAGSISLVDSAGLQSSNFVGGNAGNVTLDATKDISIVDSAIFSDTFNEDSNAGGGFAGSIFITAGQSFTVSNGQISAESFGSIEGDTADNAGFGIIFIDAPTISLSNLSRMSASTFGSGAGGDINIQTATLSVTDASRIEAVTSGAGNAGNIRVNAANTVTISGTAPLENNNTSIGSIFGRSSGLFANTEASDSGKGGNITANVETLRLADGGVLSARTRSTASGGNIEVNANNIELMSGGQIIASAFSSGAAGSVTVNAKNGIIISGSDPTYQERFDIIANFFDEGEAALRLDPDSPFSGISVNGRSTGAGGDISVETPSIRLDNRGALSAETASGNGGNITVRSRDLLLLRNNSNISTTAGTIGAGGNGGNIIIRTDNIVARENSDITANAFEGNGGQIGIATQGIFGTQFRDAQTPASDITATSEFGLAGNVEIFTPDIDPSQGLVELPEEVADVENQIARGCGSENQNEFRITGRGGLPPVPLETLDSSAVWVHLGAAEIGQRDRVGISPVTRSVPNTEIVEAQGWRINAKGEVVLTTRASTVSPHRSGLPSTECRSSRNG